MRLNILLLIFLGVVLVSGCGEDSTTPPPVRYGSLAIETLPTGLNHSWTLTPPNAQPVVGQRDTILRGLTVGTYQVIWTSIRGWLAPSPVSKALIENETTLFSGEYTLDPNALGTLSIDMTPDFLDASWQLTGPMEMNISGRGDTLLIDRTPGEYVLTASGIDDWIQPEAMTEFLMGYETLNFEIEYLLDPDHTYSLNINTDPDSLSAGWVLKIDLGDGYYDRSGFGDAALVNLPTAMQTIDWLDVPDWIVPDPAVMTITPVAGELQTVVGQYIKRPPLEIEMMPIDAGLFFMGSPASENGHQADEGPQHSVTLSRDFLISATEITQGQWEALMSENPSGYKSGPNHPVDRILWDQALEFCNALSIAEGLTPAYDLSGAITWDPNADGYRLPTEAEWEYACRAGSSTALAIGDLEAVNCLYDSKLAAMGWYCFNSGDDIQPVACRLPNDWGLYDMHGNAMEWCWDIYDDAFYTSDPVTDPSGPVDGGSHVIRSGGYNNSAQNCRSAARAGIGDNLMIRGLGFRVARNSPAGG